MRTIAAISLLVLTSFIACAQHGVAFYHLRNATFQNTNYNPAQIPKGKLFIGLPVLSGINFYLNSRLSYSDVITEDESGVKRIDADNAVDVHGRTNIFSANMHLSLLHVGIRIPSGAVFSAFVNERVEADFTYPGTLLEWAWKGNASFLGQKMNFSRIGLSSNYFREYGIALAYEIPESRLAFGARLKMYQGLVNVSTPAKFDLRVQTEIENFQLNGDVENAVVRTAGLQTLQEGGANIASYLISNPNKGFGLDAGMRYQLNKYSHVALSATDLGFISWKEGIENYLLSDTAIRYSGVQLRGSSGVDRAVQDSLIGKFELDTNTNKYIAPMVGKFTGSYIYSPMKGVDVISTVHTRLVQGQPKMAYGVGVRGYLSPRLIGSASLTKLPQQWVNIGAAFAVSAGAVQFYASADKVLGYSVPKMHWAEFRFGINLVFGAVEKEKDPSKDEYKDFSAARTNSKGVVTSTFMGKDVKVKSQDGIYTIIKKQPKPEAETITPEVNKNSHPGIGKRSATPNRRSWFEWPTRRKHNSATGSVDTSAGGGRNVRSATGQNRNDSKKRVKIRSATGSVDKGGGGRNVRSATGSSNKNSKKKKKIKSATGKNRGGGKKG